MIRLPSGLWRLTIRAIATIGLLLLGWSVVYAEAPAGRRWQTPEELRRRGLLADPQSLLQVDLRYEAEATPSLSLKHLTRKHGYVPQADQPDTGYVLSLHAANGNTLFTLTFSIPNVIADPPPLPGEAPEGGPLVLQQLDFSLTIPDVAAAVELRIADPQGIQVLQASLERVPTEYHAPNFHSLPPEAAIRTPGSGLARWLDNLVMPAAEAATTDGVALDVTFVGDNYTEADLALYHSNVDAVIDHLLTYEPFASRAGHLLFHVVDNTTLDLGCVHSTTTTRLITCNTTAVTTALNNAGAPYDKVIILFNDAAYGGSGSLNGTWAVSYNGGSMPQVAVHEFGHTLSLIDEYNLYTSNGVFDGSTRVNCYAGTPPNTAWEGLTTLAEYAVGCNYPNWYRATPCSVMLQLSCQYFNAVSQRAVNLKLDTFAGSTGPALTLTASPTLLGAGGTSTLSWSGANVTSCQASGAWSGAKTISGTESVQPSASATYTLTCTGGTASINRSVTVTVDSLSPSVALTAPADQTVVSAGATVNLAAMASDNISVAYVNFYRDAGLLGADSTSPYVLDWSTIGETSGTHTLTARAFDTAGNAATSAAIRVTLQADTTLPQVQLTSPTAGATVSGRVTLTASASDNIGVSAVRFAVDNKVLTTDTSSPYSAVWDSRKTTAGGHTITATAVDLAGNQAVHTIIVTVGNSSPGGGKGGK